MKTFATLLPSIVASAGLIKLAAGHGYVTNGTIGGTSYEFYQPYTDPYTSPTPDRVSRPIQGNGPVQDVTYQDLQCGGYTDGGINGSSPAALHAPAAAGSDVTLYWTLWPESHFGALVTYMARCPDTGCSDYMPYSECVLNILSFNNQITNVLTVPFGSRSLKPVCSIRPLIPGLLTLLR